MGCKSKSARINQELVCHFLDAAWPGDVKLVAKLDDFGNSAALPPSAVVATELSKL